MSLLGYPSYKGQFGEERQKKEQRFYIDVLVCKVAQTVSKLIKLCAVTILFLTVLKQR